MNMTIFPHKTASQHHHKDGSGFFYTAYLNNIIKAVIEKKNGIYVFKLNAFMSQFVYSFLNSE